MRLRVGHCTIVKRSEMGEMGRVVLFTIRFGLRLKPSSVAVERRPQAGAEKHEMGFRKDRAGAPRWRA